jgi:hypothetical protein
MAYVHRPIQIAGGVSPTTDFTPQSTQHFVFSDKIRFVDGLPEKIGGWNIQNLNSIFSINGCTRNVYSYVLNGNINYIIGTNTNLYSIQGSVFDNITPLNPSATTYNGDVSTFYGTLANDPFATTLGSTTVTITDTAHILQSGDAVKITGSTAVNGIPAIELNTEFSIGNVTTNTYDITVSTNATSTGSGGGASVVRASRILVIEEANDYLEGDNINISGALVAVGGIPTTAINGNHNVKNVTTLQYNIATTEFSTSSVTVNSLAWEISDEIESGLCDSTTGSGYGFGLYGAGLYGVAKSATSPTPARVWSFDRFGNLIIITHNVDGTIYSWDGDPDTLPAVITNSPTDAVYNFVSDNILITLGADNVGNRIKWCDQGNITTWTPTAQNRAGEDDIEKASGFISHAALRGSNLLFTKEQVWTFRYIDKPFVWETKLLDEGRGLIGQNARIVINGIAYWMGRDNFYFYRGGNVEIIPSNTTNQTTLKKYVYEDIEFAQESKIFCWFNEKFNEIWWHYPSSGSNEPDRIARFNIIDNTWTPDTLDRTAAEYPNVLGDFPRLADINGNFYRHENGTDDNGSSMGFTLTTPFFNAGTATVDIGGLIPDSIQTTGDITVEMNVKDYPQVPPTTVNTFVIEPDTNLVSFTNTTRYWQYNIQGDVLGQFWRAGSWAERVQESALE